MGVGSGTLFLTKIRLNKLKVSVNYNLVYKHINLKSGVIHIFSHINPLPLSFAYFSTVFIYFFRERFYLFI